MDYLQAVKMMEKQSNIRIEIKFLDFDKTLGNFCLKVLVGYNSISKSQLELSVEAE
jgi:hypothetical protein